ncbi:hypothetical protein UlMin_044116 [Ulmus minor]
MLLPCNEEAPGNSFQIRSLRSESKYKVAVKTSRQGGFKATYFIFAMMGLDNIGFVANMASMVLYFLNVMHFDNAGSATATPTTFLLTLSSCIHGSKAVLLYASIWLVGLGGGGVRGSIPALGADQFDYKNPEERKNIAVFFNWFLLSITIGATIGVTFVGYVSSNAGWDKGFIISMSCAFAGLFFLSFGKPYYRVLVVTIKNWRVAVPENSDELYEIREFASKGELIPHTNQFRVLDKAAVVAVEGKREKKWSLQLNSSRSENTDKDDAHPAQHHSHDTCLAQLQTFSVQQGTTMKTRFGHLDVPSPTIPVIPLLSMSLLIPVYEFVFVPLMRKITGHPNGITHLQRVRVGLVLSAISMAIAGIVEVKRKNQLIRHNHHISLFWLSFHYAIFGIADMFTLVGLMEFFYKEAPEGMCSLSTSFSWLSLSIGYFLSLAFVELINFITAKGTKSKRGWLEGRDLESSQVELFHWFLAILSVLNFANYVAWAKWYKYKDDENDDVHVQVHVGNANNVKAAPAAGADHNQLAFESAVASYQCQ